MSEEWQHAGWVSTLGIWAWIVILINSGIGIITSLVRFSLWGITGGIIAIVISLFIIRPKFSMPCGEKDWEALYSWTLDLGGTKVPWMFIWGILLEIFGWYWWGGAFVLVPAIMLIWFGPRKYEW